MNSGPQDKARTGVVKQVVFLVILALIALAYVATPLTAFGAGCPNGNGNGGGNSKNSKNGQGGKKKPNGQAANSKPGGKAGSAKLDQTAIADLKAGKNAGEKFADAQNKPVQLTDLKAGQKFQVIFANLPAPLQAVLQDSATAIVTLPSGAQVQCKPQKDGTANVIPIPGKSSGDRRTVLLLATSRSLQFFDSQGNSLDPSSLQVGDPFQVETAGKFLKAQYLGRGLAVVVLPSGQKTIFSLTQFLT